MSVRTRLVVALLLLAVVSLGGLTVYSYVSSEQSYRSGVEAADDASLLVLRIGQLAPPIG